jgi:hypothetical protein
MVALDARNDRHPRRSVHRCGLRQEWIATLSNPDTSWQRREARTLDVCSCSLHTVNCLYDTKRAARNIVPGLEL